MYTPKLRNQMGMKEAVLIIRPKEHTRRTVLVFITNNMYKSVFALFLKRVGMEPNSFRDNDDSSKSL